jgi:GT2 family glycosyltransferase
VTALEPALAGEPAVTRVTAILVTYQSRSDIADALSSIDRAFDRPGILGSIVVVDNASSDGTVDWLRAERPDVVLLAGTTNEGFGRACNRAFASAAGDVWLLVNPDARLQTETVAVLAAALGSRPRLAAIGPTLAGPGEVESAGMLPGPASAAGHFLFINRLPRIADRGPWRGFQLRRQPAGRVIPVEWASAAVLALRPAAIRAVGGFDPAYFLYGEDINLCARLGGAGWSIALSTATRAEHAIGASSDPRSTRWLDGLDQTMRGMDRGRASRAGFFAAVALGLGLRAAATAARRGRSGRPGQPGRSDRGARLVPSVRRAAALAVHALAGRHG